MERAKTGIKAILFFRKLGGGKMKISKNGVLTSVDAMDITEDGKLIIPASVEYIDREAFKGCDDLKEVNFAENGNLKFLVISAFEDCESLKELDVPPTIDTLFLLGSLEGCRSLETFRLPAPENLLCVNCTMGEKKESDISAFLPENTELVRYKKSAEVGGRNKN